MAPDRSQDGGRDFYGLALRDLVRARSLFHVQLLEHPNVVGTAIGRYLIRKTDPWPRNYEQQADAFSRKRKPKTERRLDNSEIRAYSWPCVLVLVREWIDYEQVEEGKISHEVLLPRQLWLPDGRVVPVCVVKAAPVELDRVPLESVLFPGSVLGPGYPVAADVQGAFRLGTIGPLVTNGERVFALTSRHVLGSTGADVNTFVQGVRATVGRCSPIALTRVPGAEACPHLELGDAYVNLDVGLIDVDEVDRWTSVAYGIGPLAPAADAGSASLSLAQIGRVVVAHGAASGPQRGEIKGLLYRYKSIAGAEYLTEFLIGSIDEGEPLTTRPGDSGTLWCIPPDPPRRRRGGRGDDASELSRRARPLAVQWGGEVVHSTSGHTAPYVLASSLSTICRLLDLDVVWDWRASLFRYWGSVGHYSIALLAIDSLPDGALKTLLTTNLDNITFPQAHITERELKGLSKRFVPLADVPDLAWKVGIAQRGPRDTNPERPNHFADMDQPGPDGRTLLDICLDPDAATDPTAWLDYYASVHENDPMHQGLLPFRVWQIFDGMVDALEHEKVVDFVCAAGVLAHYVGDACQPLHISVFADGDPNRTETRTIHHRDGTVEQQTVKAGQGVHGAYEDDMINHHVDDLFTALQSLRLQRPPEIESGEQAALATIKLMRETHSTIPPPELVDTYIGLEGERPAAVAEALWRVFGDETVAVIGKGVETLAGLWLSAWTQAGAEDSGLSTEEIDQSDITDRIKDRDFLRSYTLAEIGAHLKRAPVGAPAGGPI